MYLADISPPYVMLREAIVSIVCVTSTCYVSTVQANVAFSDVPSCRTLVSTEHHTKLTADSLSELWGIGPLHTYATLCVQSTLLHIGRWYRACCMYQVKQLSSKFSTNTAYADNKSFWQNTCAQIINADFGLRTQWRGPLEIPSDIHSSILHTNMAHQKSSSLMVLRLKLVPTLSSWRPWESCSSSITCHHQGDQTRIN